MIKSIDANVCIIGSNGRMGAMLAEKLKDKVKNLYELDLRKGQTSLHKDDIEKTIPDANIVMLCVPISALESALKDIVPKINKAGILTDITSVKIQPMKLMQKYYDGPIVGSHPLFGPDLPVQQTDEDEKYKPQTGLENRFIQQQLKSEKKVAVVPGPNAKPEDTELVENIFKVMGYKTFKTTAQTHDNAIAIIQALNFVSNLAYFATAADMPDLDKFITPSFRRRLYAAHTMLNDDAELFTNIARSTPQLRTAINSYIEALQKAATLETNSISEMLELAREYYQNVPDNT